MHYMYLLVMDVLFLYFVYGVFSFTEVLNFNVIEIVSIFLSGIGFWILLFYPGVIVSLYSLLIFSFGSFEVLFFTSRDLISLVLSFVYDEFRIEFLFFHMGVQLSPCYSSKSLSFPITL